MSVTVSVHNDGKEKWQSFEAWIEGVECEKGYGATPEEAIKNYGKELDRMAKRLTVAHQNLVLGNYETIDVDFKGDKI